MGKIKKVKPPKNSAAQNSIADGKDDVPQLVSISAAPKSSPKQIEGAENKIKFEKSSVMKKTISKKEKRANKRKKFTSKIDLIKQQRSTIDQNKKMKKKKKQENRAPVCSLKTLKDALPSLDELFKFKSSEIKTGIAEYDKPKTKCQIKKENQQKKRREMLGRLKRYTELLKDPDYIKNPRETIVNHIKFSRDLSDS